MKKHVKYKPQGVCSRKIEFDIIDGIVYNVTFHGGCKGNTAGVGALAEGMDATELVKRLKGIPCKGDNSCPNQLAIAIEQNL
ncbi:MAG: TIGR03905 family TSCPD domain-containing protein [Bacteroides sp.]|nr:TIGR03905 family TSCPD domain-containing protein [Eubacterium sp.]MCM1418217.1 TIGR03905 family TSCPD domain-containing protein [Roseburia sp.]MCM1462768.1 TIGR03905 family TSCPD domain-containing protein [Bacteroides sp.]